MHLEQQRPRTALPRGLASALATSAALALPCLALGLWTGRGRAAPVPPAAYLTLWVVSFVLVLAARALRAALAQGVPASGAGRFRMARALAVFLLACGFWLFTIADQLPCLLGVPNCD